MSTAVHAFDVEVRQVESFAFRATFDKPHYGEVRLDEPAPLGSDSAPNAARLLAAAIANCLAASLLFCMQRSGVKVSGLGATAHVELVRNEQKRLRIGRVDVKLHVPAGHAELARCQEAFEDFCVVTQSVRAGLDVNVSLA